MAVRRPAPISRRQTAHALDLCAPDARFAVTGPAPTLLTRPRRPKRQTERETVLKPVMDYLALVGIPRKRVTVTGRPLPGGGWADNPMRGWPDIVALLPGGRFLGIECKAATAQSDAQREFQAWCEAAGGLYVVVHSVAELRAWLAEVQT